ncbi:hypothetical protein P8452_69486 [Trifolium repens]|nr:hypothetical protein P8452_69486 [Trifolium repens]
MDNDDYRGSCTLQLSKTSTNLKSRRRVASVIVVGETITLQLSLRSITTKDLRVFVCSIKSRGGFLHMIF